MPSGTSFSLPSLSWHFTACKGVLRYLVLLHHPALVTVWSRPSWACSSESQKERSSLLHQLKCVSKQN